MRLLYLSRWSDVKPDGEDELDEELEEDPCPQAEIESVPIRINKNLNALVFIKILSMEITFLK